MDKNNESKEQEGHEIEQAEGQFSIQGQNQQKADLNIDLKDKSFMKAVFVEEFGKPLVVKEAPVPKPKSGELLIKIEAFTVNPVDLEFLKGMSIHKQHLPSQVGYEASGTVIASGGGLIARTYLGKRVSFGKSGRQPGTWAQYAVTEAQHCLPLDKSVSFEEGACGVINPMTAVAFIDIAKKEGHKAIVQTAAASQLGRMMVKLCKKEGIKTINIVRKPEQKKILEDLGADAVLNSEEPDFENCLKKVAAELNGTLCLESICGAITHQVIRALPKNSLCFIYGHLDKEELTDLDFNDILANGKIIKGFIFRNWFKEQGLFGKLAAAKKVQKLLATDLKSEISKTFPMEEINEAIKYYSENMTLGKVVLKPN